MDSLIETWAHLANKNYELIQEADRFGLDIDDLQVDLYARDAERNS